MMWNVRSFAMILLLRSFLFLLWFTGSFRCSSHCALRAHLLTVSFGYCIFQYSKTYIWFFFTCLILL